MNQHDILYRFIFDNLDIRGELVYLNQTWKAVMSRGDYPEAVREQLSQALIATAILSASIKHEGALIFQVQGDGPLRTLVTQADHDGALRGLAKWSGQVPDKGLKSIYGNGQMALTTTSQHRERYQSIVPLEGDNLGEALEHYFQSSEQLTSRFWLTGDNDTIAGLFLQRLPAARSNEDDWRRVTLLAETVTKNELIALPAESLLNRLFHEEKVRLFDPKPLRFSCHCSREKIGLTLSAMKSETIQDILNTEGSIEVDCEFCNQHYSFSQKDIDSLLDELPGALH